MRPFGQPRAFLHNDRVTADHYFSSSPSTPENARAVSFAAAGREFTLTAASGVFSAGRLDPGTAVLLRKAPLPVGPGPLLDLGCGYGPIACVLASVSPGPVYAVDVNARARDLTVRNAAALGLDVTVAAPDDVPPDVRFAQIWSNPPIRIGKPGLHALLERWLPALADGGVAWLVVARHLGGDSVQAWLTERGWTAERHASSKGFRVLRVARKSD